MLRSTSLMYAPLSCWRSKMNLLNDCNDNSRTTSNNDDDDDYDYDCNDDYEDVIPVNSEMNEKEMILCSNPFINS